jgi:C4-dicarboxylate-specific signal transduction histidine kinase
VTLAVADSGPGVPDDLALRVFDPFFTTKPVGQGTGLGLSISHKIVAENGGTLSVSNRPEGGALFRVTLPGGRAP